MRYAAPHQPIRRFREPKKQQPREARGPAVRLSWGLEAPGARVLPLSGRPGVPPGGDPRSDSQPEQKVASSAPPFLAILRPKVVPK